VVIDEETGKPKTATVMCGEVAVAGHRLRVGEPGPDPEPDPEPDPDPRPRAASVLLLFESDNVDDLPWLANITTTQKLRQLNSKDFRVWVADKDEKSETGDRPALLRAWVEYVEKKNLELPQLFFLAKDQTLVHNQPPLKTVDETVRLVKEYMP